MEKVKTDPLDKLRNWLMATRQPGEDAYARYARFGKQLGVTMFAVRKWLYGDRRIPDDVKLKIVKITRGKIKLNDMVRG